MREKLARHVSVLGLMALVLASAPTQANASIVLDEVIDSASAASIILPETDPERLVEGGIPADPDRLVALGPLTDLESVLQANCGHIRDGRERQRCRNDERRSFREIRREERRLERELRHERRFFEREQFRHERRFFLGHRVVIDRPVAFPVPVPVAIPVPAPVPVAVPIPVPVAAPIAVGGCRNCGNVVGGNFTPGLRRASDQFCNGDRHCGLPVFRGELVRGSEVVLDDGNGGRNCWLLASSDGWFTWGAAAITEREAQNSGHC